jgi:hypothetical protein
MVYIHGSGLYEQPQRRGEIALFCRTAVICEILNKFSLVTDTNQMMKTIITSLAGIKGRLQAEVLAKYVVAC